MEDKNCELLFEYLRSILYDSQIDSLDIKSLDEPFQKLGMGLQYLEKAVTEMKQYSEALSIGNLSVTPPGRDNFLCENLKNIHANLNHLTWQAKQVAKGDYSQTVSYLGEFSDAFNSMTRQLSEREAVLKEEAQMEKEREEQLIVEAHQDRLTRIGNRHFFFQQAEALLSCTDNLIFCYCDLDHLKYVNDNFGHAEGDWYLRFFVSTVSSYIRKEDIFARIGGDEFCIILQNCPPARADEKMQNIQTAFINDKGKPYPKSFSYGIIELKPDHPEITVEQIIQKADAVMYEQKRAHQTSGLPKGTF